MNNATAIHLRVLGVAVFIVTAVLSMQAQKVLTESVKDLASQIAASATKEQKRKIAIVPFRELDGRTTVLGTFIAEELATDLFSAGNFEIIERTMLERVFAELKLNASGVIDPQTAKQLGKVAGVDAIVTGTITDLQSYIAVNSRMIDSQTGSVFAVAQARVVRDDDVKKIMEVTLGSDPLSTQASLPSNGLVSGSGSSEQRAAQSNPGSVPIFQSDAIKATVSQVAVASNNSRAAVSVTVENTSREPLYLGLSFNGAALSDDRATRWMLDAISGIQRMTGDYTTADKYTFIGPAQRINVLITFANQGYTDDSVPGTTFSFTADATQLAGTKLRRVSIGLAGVKGTALK